MIQHHAIAIAIQATEVVDGPSDVEMACCEVAREQRERIALDILALAKTMPELGRELIKSINSHMKSAQDGESADLEAGPTGSRGRSGRMNGIGIDGWEWPEAMTLHEKLVAYNEWSDRESMWRGKVVVCQRALSLWTDCVPEGTRQSATTQVAQK